MDKKDVLKKAVRGKMQGEGMKDGGMMKMGAMKEKIQKGMNSPMDAMKKWKEMKGGTGGKKC
jgi:hypothetical protein